MHESDPRELRLNNIWEFYPTSVPSFSVTQIGSFLLKYVLYKSSSEESRDCWGVTRFNSIAVAVKPWRKGGSQDQGGSSIFAPLNCCHSDSPNCAIDLTYALYCFELFIHFTISCINAVLLFPVLFKQRSNFLYFLLRKGIFRPGMGSFSH